MDSFSDITPLWDLSQATNFSQLPDDDFLALLQKQFPGAGQFADNNLGFGDSVNPQSISQYSLPSATPPSDDSSPSPPTNAESNKQSPETATEEPSESALKRKASSEDLEEGPSQKNQHTASGSNSRKTSISTTKRKTSGAGPDESRLLKRKEQNRAAQRAFRERKEKHVKDLEDKVAALEAKNEQTTAENENLRDLLSRLQTENMALKQASFTFSVPKTAASTSSAKSPTFTSLFSRLPRIPYTAPDPTKYTNPLDVTSLMSFNPNVLNLLEESPPQRTATDGASLMDFGFGNKEDSFIPSNYTTIASNPAFFSLASVFDHIAPPANSSAASPPQPSTSNDQSSFSFDFNSLTPWPTSPPNTQDAGTLDDLFGGIFSPQHTLDVNAILNTPSAAVSPVVHHQNPNLSTGSPGTSASSSPASHMSDPLFSTRESSSSESDPGHEEDCPKTKEEFCKHIADSGPSAFVSDLGAKYLQPVSCQGNTSFPSVEKSDKNVPVLDAWRNITRDPQYKECDITSLCAEFASKARCDGSKVVLEPQGMSNIMEKLVAKKRQQQ